MWRRILAVGLAAGLAGGLLSALVHHGTTTPLLLQAEHYEHARDGDVAESAPPAYQYQPASAAALQRTARTFLSTVFLSIGFGLLLSGCFALCGRTVNGRNGVLWGLAGFAVFGLAPALGQPPDIPGVAQEWNAANLGARQAWWLLCVACSAAGLALLVFGRNIFWRGAGLIALLFPHLLGAPPPPPIGADAGAATAALATRFATTTLLVGALSWSLLGWLSGVLYRRWVPAHQTGADHGQTA